MPTTAATNFIEKDFELQVRDLAVPALIAITVFAIATGSFQSPANTNHLQDSHNILNVSSNAYGFFQIATEPANYEVDPQFKSVNYTRVASNVSERYTPIFTEEDFDGWS